MNKGYIRLHRKILDCPVFGNEKLLKVWIWCLLKATHDDFNVTIGRQIVELKKGQFVFGRHMASDELMIPASTVWSHIKLLEKYEMLEIESNNKFSIVTIANWELYQEDSGKSNNKRKRTKKEEDTNKHINTKTQYIIPPTIEMVEQYCLEQKLPINPQKFMDYYDSNGWKVGKSKMKDWQATVRSWARRESEYNPQPAVQEIKKYNI